MFWIVLLVLFFGMMLILLEALLPHGISAMVGISLVGLGVFLAWREDPQTGFLILGLALPVSGIAAWWAFRSGVSLMRLAPPPRPGAGSESVPAEGDVVEVVQSLRPTGTVLWRGTRLPARTVRPETESVNGTQMRVCGRDSIYLLVQPLEKEEENAVQTQPESHPGV